MLKMGYKDKHGINHQQHNFDFKVTMQIDKQENGFSGLDEHNKRGIFNRGFAFSQIDPKADASRVQLSRQQY